MRCHDRDHPTPSTSVLVAVLRQVPVQLRLYALTALLFTTYLAFSRGVANQISSSIARFREVVPYTPVHIPFVTCAALHARIRFLKIFLSSSARFAVYVVSAPFSVYFNISLWKIKPGHRYSRLGDFRRFLCRTSQQ